MFHKLPRGRYVITVFVITILSQNQNYVIRRKKKTHKQPHRNKFFYK